MMKMRSNGEGWKKWAASRNGEQPEQNLARFA
jgi:hypothetical protein